MSRTLILRATERDTCVAERRIDVRDRRCIKIGRGGAADIQLDSRDVARVHAILEVQGDRLWIRDLGTLKGSFVNGARIPMRGVQLAPEDVIAVGPYQIGARWAEAPVRPPEARPTTRERLQSVGVALTGARAALLHNLDRMSERTAVEMEAFLAQTRAQRQVLPAMATPADTPRVAEGRREFYDTRQIVSRMRRDERRDKASVAFWGTLALAAAAVMTMSIV